MNTIDAIILGALQGVAEFLPISSSGHLLLLQNLIGLEDTPLLYDIFLHVATLLSVIIFFWKKIIDLIKVFFRWVRRKYAFDEKEKAQRKFIIAVFITTFITGVIGIFLEQIIIEASINFVCGCFVFTGILLITSSVLTMKNQSLSLKGRPYSISAFQASFIGLAQGLGTLPGISRSGSTISVALLSGVPRDVAADYSFIVSIPAVLGAFVLELSDLKNVNWDIGMTQLLAGCVTAFVCGLVALTLLMKVIKGGKFYYFAIYLIPVGLAGFLFL